MYRLRVVLFNQLEVLIAQQRKREVPGVHNLCTPNPSNPQEPIRIMLLVWSPPWGRQMVTEVLRCQE